MSTPFRPIQSIAGECAASHERFIAKVAEGLDIESGLEEVLLAQRHLSLAEQLHEQLDVESGLAAIVLAPDMPAQTPACAPAGHITDVASIAPRTKLALRESYLPRVESLVRAAQALQEIARSLSHLAQAIFEIEIPRQSKWSRKWVRSRKRVPTLMDAYFVDARDVLTAFPPVNSALADSGHSIDVLHLVGYNDVADKLLEAQRSAGLFDRRLNQPQANMPSFRVLAIRLQDETSELFTTCWEMSLRLLALRDAANDFVGADLRDLVLDELDLTGIRWSSTTLWPSLDWYHRIRASSEQIGDDLFEVRGSTARQMAAVIPS
jgi:hypothetical protein